MIFVSSTRAPYKNKYNIGFHCSEKSDIPRYIYFLNFSETSKFELYKVCRCEISLFSSEVVEELLFIGVLLL